ncbi:MAG: porin family protein [Alphaproteobacteria bacterium]|nr:porin family protein [Alphaproteobacteria bacterium]
MKRFVLAASAAVAVLATAGAQAQDFTFSGGYERADFDGVELDTVVLRGSYFFNENFGVEGQLNFGVNDESVTVGTVTADVDMDYGFGAFGVYRFPASDNFNFFARAGYLHAELEASVANFSVSDDDGAFAAGIGAEWMFDDRNGVRFDYTYADYDNEANFYGISYVRRFGG